MCFGAETTPYRIGLIAALVATFLMASDSVFARSSRRTDLDLTRYPDFTIEDEISGRTVYWEHLGMLDREDYRASWEKKLAWYRASGIHPASESKSGAPMLVTTTDSAENGLDMVQVKKLIAEIC